jgi:hypothetical protein
VSNTLDIVERLRALSLSRHSDLSVGDEAADIIESLQREITRLQKGLYEVTELVAQASRAQGEAEGRACFYKDELDKLKKAALLPIIGR